MEDLPRPSETLTIPVSIPMRAYRRDHYVSGQVVLPAVEALQILAATLPPGAGADPRRQEAAGFSHLLVIGAGKDEIPAIHEWTPLADGRCRSRLYTVRSGRQAHWTRRVEHAEVVFAPAASAETGRGQGERHAESEYAWVEMPVGARSAAIPVGPVETERAEAGGPLHVRRRAAPVWPGNVMRLKPSTCAVPAEERHTTGHYAGDDTSPAGTDFIVAARRLYEELVPFGPAYRNVAGDVRLNPDGAEAMVSGGSHPEAEGPLGSPFPFDAALHAACAWGQRYRGIVAFPVGFDQREILRPTRAGDTYPCRVVPRTASGATLRFDIVIAGGDGLPFEIIRGVAMRDISGGRRMPPAWVREGT